ncbi:hypothetical protein [Mycolicibacterium mengxianglii]|uniref:hypothetical protein n=1 Tax=Mycolicibacterium mengxianglii TaxID=2736649 RepID=UPI0018EEE87F|nr:hypothetical protein [Mycolicibacterium mengxianglii]
MRDKTIYDEVAVLRARKRSRGVSPMALELHVRAIDRSVHTDCPVFVSDALLDEIAPGHVTTIAALELTLAGLWDRARDGYVVSDLELIDRLGGNPLRRALTSGLRRCWQALNRDNFIPL